MRTVEGLRESIMMSVISRFKPALSNARRSTSKRSDATILGPDATLGLGAACLVIPEGRGEALLLIVGELRIRIFLANRVPPVSPVLASVVSCVAHWEEEESKERHRGGLLASLRTRHPSPLNPGEGIWI